MILHIMTRLDGIQKFNLAFYDFIKNSKKLNSLDHRFCLIGSKPSAPNYHNLEFSYFSTSVELAELEKLMDDSERIIVHGLWRKVVNGLLLASEDRLEKSYWFIFGADYYNPERYDEQHHQVIKRIGYKVTVMEEVFNNIKRLYPNTGGRWLECCIYPSNIIISDYMQNKPEYRSIGLLGHSGVEDNEHIKFINLLKNKNFNITQLICPLSYPLMNPYVKSVIEEGNLILKERFHSLIKFMSAIDYEREVISIVDFAVFPSWRTHGFGTLVKTLGHGASVYLDPKVSTYHWLKKIGVTAYPLDDINNLTTNLSRLTPSQREKNVSLIRSRFTNESLEASLYKIFHEKDNV